MQYIDTSHPGVSPGHKKAASNSTTPLLARGRLIATGVQPGHDRTEDSCDLMVPAAVSAVIVRAVSPVVRVVIAWAVIAAVVIRGVTVVIRRRHPVHVRAVIAWSDVVRHARRQARSEHNGKQHSTQHGGLLDRGKPHQRRWAASVETARLTLFKTAESRPGAQCPLVSDKWIYAVHKGPNPANK